MTGSLLTLLAWTPPGPTPIRDVATAPASSNTPSVSVSRSRRKMSGTPFVSPATTLSAADENTT